MAIPEAVMVDMDLTTDLYGTVKDASGAEIWMCGSGEFNPPKDCGRLWTSKQQAHCAGCHEHFSSDSAADEHFIKVPDYGPRPFPTCKPMAEGATRLVHVRDRWGGMWGWPPQPQGVWR